MEEERLPWKPLGFRVWGFRGLGVQGLVEEERVPSPRTNHWPLNGALVGLDSGYLGCTRR